MSDTKNLTERATLHVHLAHAKGKAIPGRRNAFEKVTVVIVRFGTVDGPASVLGSIKLGGRWQAEQALREWHKDKTRFKLTEAGKGFLNPVSVE